MSVRDAGRAIREARIKAGLTQEKLSEGICSSLSLSRIEKGTAGVSPATFQALMAHAGAPCEVFPVYENWNDYECFFHLKHARFHLDAWQLEPAFEELEKVEEKGWNKNRFYYQEWLMLHGMLQFRSGTGKHELLYDLFMEALRISRPEILLEDFRSLLLSVNEIELLLAVAQEALYLNRPELCHMICAQIDSYLASSQITFLEKGILRAEHGIVYAKYLIAVGDYERAFYVADANRHQMVVDSCNAPLLELTFLTGLCSFYMGKRDEALKYFKSALYSAHAIESCYVTVCRNYVREHLELALPENLLALPDIPLKSFPRKEPMDTAAFSDGVYDFYGADVVTVGRLIRELRTEQKLSQQVLCRGLCSVSKLSKIENGSLQPDVILAETLLQRLGLSEREFAFWGNAREARFYELKFKMMRTDYLPDVNKEEVMCELQHFVAENDMPLYKQFYLYEKAQYANAQDKIAIFKNALDCTLPGFEIHDILKYRLSWMELTILNNISFAYRDTAEPYQGIIYFRQILEYQKTVKPDIILQSQTLSVSLTNFYMVLYRQGHYKEMVDLAERVPRYIYKYVLEQFGSFYFYYSQVLGECGRAEKAALPARYSCGLENLREAFANEPALVKCLQRDFSIDIGY